MTASIFTAMRDIGGKMRSVERVSALLGVYHNPINGLYYAVDWQGGHRAAFQYYGLARRWCHVVEKNCSQLPSSNTEIEIFNDLLKRQGWRVGQLLGDCQVWEFINGH